MVAHYKIYEKFLKNILYHKLDSIYMSKISLLKLVDACAVAQEGCAWERWARLAAVGSTLGLGRASRGAQGGSIHLLHCRSAQHATEPAHPTAAICAGPSQGAEPHGHDLGGPRQCAPSMSSGSKEPRVVTTSIPSGFPKLCVLPRAAARDHPRQDCLVHPLRPNGVYLGALCNLLGACHHSQKPRKHT